VSLTYVKISKRSTQRRMLVEPSPTPTSGVLHAQQRVGWQPNRFLTDRAKAERGLRAGRATRQRQRRRHPAGHHLAVTSQGLHPPPPRHASAQPAPSSSTWAAVGDNGHIGNGRRLVADGRSGPTGIGGSSVELPRSVGQRGRACNATDGADASLVRNTCIVVMPPRHRRLSLRRSPTTHQQRLLLPFPHVSTP
jgi:hypothetical protein